MHCDSGERCLVFSLGDDFRSAVKLKCVIEIVPAMTLSAAPGACCFVEGLMNIRGEIIPVINMRRVFQLKDRSLSDCDHIIIVRTNEHRKVGLRVDRAIELLELNPSGVHQLSMPFVESVENRGGSVIFLHDPSALESILSEFTESKAPAAASGGLKNI